MVVEIEYDPPPKSTDTTLKQDIFPPPYFCFNTGSHSITQTDPPASDLLSAGITGMSTVACYYVFLLKTNFVSNDVIL